MAARQLDEGLISVGQADKETSFQVDRVFDEEVTNRDIFKGSVQPILDCFLSGTNCTIFAYGITGAGKSHTMFGSSDNSQSGLIDQALSYICTQAGEL